MALSNAERQKLFRQRKRDDKLHSPDALSGSLKTSFSDWLTDQDWQDVIHDLDIIGVREVINFPATNDKDPFFDADVDETDRGSIGAAERIVTTFLDAAVTMASKINKYKLEQIEHRMAAFGAIDLPDGEAKRAAITEMAKLTKYQDELSKSVRWTLPQWKVTGE